MKVCSRAKLPSLVKEGWLRPLIKCREASEAGADGREAQARQRAASRLVGSTTDNRWLEQTTPSAPSKEDAIFLTGAATPPCPRRGVLFGCGFAAICLCLFLHSAFAQETRKTVWDGVYNTDQARRGLAVFLDSCSTCHGRDLEGADMTPPLTGAAFMSNWDGLTVGDLADRIRISMPLNTPGSLSRQQNADVVAYILQFNQFPSGKEEMPREVQAMKQILFKATK